TARSIRIAPHSRCWMRPGWRHVLRIRLAKVGCPTQRGLALLKCCEATILTAVLRVKRTPRIVLRLGWIVEHSRRSNDTEHKQDKFHQHAPIGDCSRLNNKKSWRGSSLISVKIKIAVWPPAYFYNTFAGFLRSFNGAREHSGAKSPLTFGH